MINLSQIKIEDIIKKSDNLVIIAIILLGLIITVKVNAKNVSLSNALTKKISVQKKMSSLFTKINGSASDYQDYRKKIFFEKDSSVIVNLVNEWARNYDVEVTSIKPQYVKESGKFLYVPIELEAKTDYFGLGQFLGQIENYEGFIDVTSLRVFPQGYNRGEKNIKQDQLNISLSFTAVALKDLDISEVITKRR
jgi:hypothetical protein